MKNTDVPQPGSIFSHGDRRGVSGPHRDKSYCARVGVLSFRWRSRNASVVVQASFAACSL